MVSLLETWSWIWNPWWCLGSKACRGNSIHSINSGCLTWTHLQTQVMVARHSLLAMGVRCLVALASWKWFYSFLLLFPQEAERRRDQLPFSVHQCEWVLTQPCSSREPLLVCIRFISHTPQPYSHTISNYGLLFVSQERAMWGSAVRDQSLQASDCSSRFSCFFSNEFYDSDISIMDSLVMFIFRFASISEIWWRGSFSWV